MSLLIPLTIAILIIAGAITHKITQVNDSPQEQVIEAVLKTQGIDIDFSQQAKEDAKNNP